MQETGDYFLSGIMLQQREQLERIFSAITGNFFSQDGALWLWEFPSEILYFSGDAGHITKKFSGKKRTWRTLLHTQDRKDFIDRLDRITLSAENGGQVDFFHRLKSRTGDHQWVLTKFHVLDRDEAGRATRVIAASFDLATLNRQKEMHDNADRIQHALDAARAGLWDWDAETNEVYYSPRYATMMGYDPENFPHELSSWASRVHRDDLEETMRLQYGYINSPELGDVFESTYRFRAADGTYNWIMSRAKVVGRDENGRARRIIGLHTIVNELHETQETLTNIVNTDQLTRLSSRLALDAELASLTEEDYPVSLIYIDMDGLKLVNDNLGHEEGDNLLLSAAGLVRNVFRARDTVARVGGDEFVALLPRCPVNVALRLMRNIRSACRKHNADPDNLPIFLSMGMASTEQGVGLFQLQAEADQSMIQQKRRSASGNYRLIHRWIGEHADRQIQDADIP